MPLRPLGAVQRCREEGWEVIDPCNGEIQASRVGDIHVSRSPFLGDCDIVDPVLGALGGLP
eukprot:1783795-Alexandrium_andersonii.AAC.1